jgi:glycosyltransferase involved in cell wall biosynthesis
MKVLFVGNINNSHEQKWVIPLAELGHEVHIISPEDYAAKGNVIVHLYDPDKLYANDNFLVRFAKKTLDLRRYIREIKPDVLHFQFVVDLAYTAPFLGFKNIVLTPWGSDVLIFPQRSRRIYYFLKFTLHSAQVITYLSDQLLARMNSIASLKGKRVIKVIYSVTKNFKDFIKQDEIAAFKKEHSLTPQNKIVISFRNIMEVYNLEEIIQAMAIVIKKDPAVRFIIKYEYNIVERVEKIKALVKEQGIAGQTIFVGAIPNNKMFNFYALSDVGVSFSKSDGCPVSVLEAMAVGLPLVVSDIPANRQILQAQSAKFTKLGEINKLAENISVLLNDKPKAQEQTASAYHDLLRLGFNEDNVKKLDEMYSMLIL